MKFSVIADCYEEIEATAKRLEMTSSLVELLKLTPTRIVDKVVYLTQGKLYPDFVDVQTGVAEKLAVQAVAKATGESERKIQSNLAETGDVGETAQRFLEKKPQATLFKAVSLTVEDVYERLVKIARTSGSGSTERKLSLLAGLLTNATSKEAKYIIRIVTGSLRLGVADMTVLDALAVAYGGGRDAREALERAYNISSDLGIVAKEVAEKGRSSIREFRVVVGNPMRPMLAERLSSSEDIFEKLGKKFMAEFKYDGERLQVHKQGDRIMLFSRRLENITNQYPDAVDLLREHVESKDAILEAECVAVDIDTGEMKPFQELMHRRRKYGVNKAMEEHPVSLFMFDLLYADGKDYTLEPYLTRRQKLEKTVTETERVRLSKSLMIHNVKSMERFFAEAVERGCEGLVCKSIAENSTYQAGARGWLWIKYKREYKSEMTDRVDLVVVGALHGRGRRAGTYGALLLAAYNPSEDTFETVTKCGTGLTDEDLEKLPNMMERHKLLHKHARVKSILEADLWFAPSIVIEVLGAEITLSPIHTCAMDTIRKGCGLAIRFPRFTGRYRSDKSPEDATTVEEILNMYRRQLKRLKESHAMQL
ncbi:MAG: ATP-dependent DNA ligase [Candidatus Bathyarchaeota archaeon]|nr:MAG: ATP-dependent DNA ligase [Candidatus Bathyarchaeota archaeon]